ncbi:energy-coupling factor transport system ATP-binding protein [Actinoplanes lutulentus]|uniref:Energy-coupling factor transport system ATP-binding protein n=1 Tax=Actinoplanes lutulentus TaxID=1287878 RepID=A0A327ZGW0_9ACTN|nr:ABC transporter ATP-binding protein [Actinoplanes lutulentus]MBB2941996.1 energy-coupling factor transport system ATP-binding protein [Actinoplanes lutulentus]RAK39908.1 energy-coupling factor transport system ATP-binding protein [Actinoplanes lutulentus]
MSEVQLRGFGWRHAGRRAWAVRGLDLHVRHGERVLLLGPSGAGKSTLLAALAGLLPSDSGQAEGSIEIDGLDPGKARDRVGILFQDPQTQLVMARSGDDVAFGCENRGIPAAEIWPRVSDVLDRVGFRYPINRSTAALSGGEAQRLALAGVLALRPGLLLLDEPTANLDPPGADLVREALTRSTGPETTMIIVEHRVAEALPLVDRVVVLEPGGGVRADGTPELIFAAYGDKLADEGVWVPGFSFPPLKANSRSTTDFVRAEHTSVRGRLSPVSISAGAGEVLAVTGPNGAGKSTLALLLGGLLAPSSGRIEAFGDKRPPHRWRAATLTQRIGSVFQNPEHQFVTGRVADELALGPRRVGRSPAEIRKIVDELLERLRLTKLAEANPYTLSGGEARRLSVATALATAPRLLVLDEPTFGQDRRTWLELISLLAELRTAGHGIVAVTHDEAFVRTLADRTVPLGEPDPEPLPRRVRP